MGFQLRIVWGWGGHNELRGGCWVRIRQNEAKNARKAQQKMWNCGRLDFAFLALPNSYSNNVLLEIHILGKNIEMKNFWERFGRFLGE